MPALDERTIIFFIAGIEPTAAEAALIARIRGTVLVRSADTSFSPLYGTHLETADGLAGSIPDSYKTGEGTTIDTALYPSGDVTPTTTAVPEDFDVFPATMALKVGETKDIPAISGDLNETTGVITLTNKAAAATVEWASSDETKATVDTNGIVTGVAAGTANITATYTPAEGETPIESVCAVTVSAASIENELVLPATASVVVGKTVNLFAAEAKSDGTISNVTTTAVWSSGTEANATVGAATGVVTGVQAGESVITATKGGKTATCTVTVVAATTEAVKVLPATLTIAGLATFQLECAEAKTDDTVVSATATAGAWVSSDPTKASINADTGVVTGAAAGETTITFTKNTKTSTCVVTCTG